MGEVVVPSDTNRHKHYTRGQTGKYVLGTTRGRFQHPQFAGWHRAARGRASEV